MWRKCFLSLNHLVWATTRTQNFIFEKHKTSGRNLKLEENEEGKKGVRAYNILLRVRYYIVYIKGVRRYADLQLRQENFAQEAWLQDINPSIFINTLELKVEIVPMFCLK